MAHNCPTCYMTCHCGGDIDDICFESTKYCCHCEESDEEDPDPVYCSNCGWLTDESEHKSTCGNRNPFYD